MERGPQLPGETPIEKEEMGQLAFWGGLETTHEPSYPSP